MAPRLLEALAKDRTFILVSGTNGKTTTTSMLTAGWGQSVATNSTGANMPAGHVAALCANDSTRVVLEVDEAWLPSVIQATSPRVIVLLNLSRDQLDRANEVRNLAARWRVSLESVSSAGLTVVANANDPLVVFAAQVAERVEWCDVPTSWHDDATSCPVCTRPIHFNAHGWSCICGFARPTDFRAVLRDRLHIGGVEVDLDLELPGEFNRGNAAMALAALEEVGCPPEEAVLRVNAITSVAGRFSVRHWRGHTVKLMLAKNPAGFDAMLTMVQPDDSEVWISINARTADGRDPSWLYDVGFEALRGHRVYCFGDRRLDLATRLAYAGVEFVVVDEGTNLQGSEHPVLVLANYTAFDDFLTESRE